MTLPLSRRSLVAAAALGPLLGRARPRPAAAESRPPNIVIVNLDDLETGSLAFMPKVQALLVDEGTSFDNFVVTQPGCTPSRASLLRGQYVHNHGVLRSSGAFGGFQRFFDLGHEESTVATWLQDAGYRTALVGKYLNHYPGEREPTYVPPGWDEWDAPTEGSGNEIGKGYRNYTLNENGRLVAYGKDPADYATDVFAARAEAFVTRAAAEGAPFFLYLAPRAPHLPAQPAARHAGAFADVDLPQPAAYDEADVSDKPEWVQATTPLTPEQAAEIDAVRRARLETLLAVDDLVARLIDRLEAAGELGRTFVFFTSDNGMHLGEQRLADRKGTPYEESIRVPLIVRGPGVPAGATESRLVGMADLAPTFAELAGVAAPDFVDGRSVAALLGAGGEPDGWRNALLSETPRNSGPRARRARRDDEDTGGGPPVPAWAALRRQRDVYVEYETGEREFYDLAEDPDQMENLAGALDDATTVRLSAHLAALVGCAGDACRVAEDAAFDDSATIPPLPTIAEPAADAAPRFGEEIALRGSALDAAGQPVPAANLVWSARARAGDEVIDLLAETAGNDLRLALPGRKAVGGRVTLEIALTATDANGNARTVERSLLVRRPRESAPEDRRAARSTRPGD